MTHLANDIVRCHDAICPEREQCRRYIDRDDPPHQVRVVHAASLRPLLGGGRCGSRIPTDIGQMPA